MKQKKTKNEIDDNDNQQEFVDMEVSGPMCAVSVEVPEAPAKQTKTFDKHARAIFQKGEVLSMVDANNVPLNTTVRAVDKAGNLGVVIFPGARIRLRASVGKDLAVRTDWNLAFQKGIQVQSFDGNMVQIVNSSGTRITIQQDDVIGEIY